MVDYFTVVAGESTASVLLLCALSMFYQVPTNYLTTHKINHPEQWEENGKQTCACSTTTTTHMQIQILELVTFSHKRRG